MDNEAFQQLVLQKLGNLTDKVDNLEKGQTGLINRMDNLEKGQKKLQRDVTVIKRDLKLYGKISSASIIA